MASSLSSSNHKVAIVTGSSSGIGFETSLVLAKSGFFTYATMRNLGKGESLKSVAAKRGPAASRCEVERYRREIDKRCGTFDNI